MPAFAATAAPVDRPALRQRWPYSHAQSKAQEKLRQLQVAGHAAWEADEEAGDEEEEEGEGQGELAAEAGHEGGQPGGGGGERGSQPVSVAPQYAPGLPYPSVSRRSVQNSGSSGIADPELIASAQGLPALVSHRSVKRLASRGPLSSVDLASPHTVASHAAVYNERHDCGENKAGREWAALTSLDDLPLYLDPKQDGAAAPKGPVAEGLETPRSAAAARASRLARGAPSGPLRGARGATADLRLVVQQAVLTSSSAAAAAAATSTSSYHTTTLQATATTFTTTTTTTVSSASVLAYTHTRTCSVRASAASAGVVSGVMVGSGRPPGSQQAGRPLPALPAPTQGGGWPAAAAVQGDGDEGAALLTSRRAVRRCAMHALQRAPPPPPCRAARHHSCGAPPQTADWLAGLSPRGNPWQRSAPPLSHPAPAPGPVAEGQEGGAPEERPPPPALPVAEALERQRSGPAPPAPPSPFGQPVPELLLPLPELPGGQGAPPQQAHRSDNTPLASRAASRRDSAAPVVPHSPQDAPTSPLLRSAAPSGGGLAHRSSVDRSSSLGADLKSAADGNGGVWVRNFAMAQRQRSRTASTDQAGAARAAAAAHEPAPAAGLRGSDEGASVLQRSSATRSSGDAPALGGEGAPHHPHPHPRALPAAEGQGLQGPVLSSVEPMVPGPLTQGSRALSSKRSHSRGRASTQQDRQPGQGGAPDALQPAQSRSARSSNENRGRDSLPGGEPLQGRRSSADFSGAQRRKSIGSAGEGRARRRSMTEATDAAMRALLAASASNGGGSGAAAPATGQAHSLERAWQVEAELRERLRVSEASSSALQRRVADLQFEHAQDEVLRGQMLEQVMALMQLIESLAQRLAGVEECVSTMDLQLQTMENDTSHVNVLGTNLNVGGPVWSAAGGMQPLARAPSMRLKGNPSFTRARSLKRDVSRGTMES